jgi:hypothetical protein
VRAAIDAVLKPRRLWQLIETVPSTIRGPAISVTHHIATIQSKVSVWTSVGGHTWFVFHEDADGSKIFNAFFGVVLVCEHLFNTCTVRFRSANSEGQTIIFNAIFRSVLQESSRASHLLGTQNMTIRVQWRENSNAEDELDERGKHHVAIASLLSQEYEKSVGCDMTLLFAF